MVTASEPKAAIPLPLNGCSVRNTGPLIGSRTRCSMTPRRTIRTECLDHLIVIDERHLRAVLGEFADYYNRDRPHRSLWLKYSASQSRSWSVAESCRGRS